MKALLLYGPRDLRVEEVDDPLPRPRWVRIKVKRVGICGTDKAFYRGTYRLFRQPLIPGHEIAGVVDEVGDNVSEDLVRHRVTTEINIYCGKCWFCRNNMYTHCPYREVIGITRDGGMAEYVLTREDLVHVVDDLDFDEIAFIEPLAAVIEMVEMEKPKPGSRIAIMGVGTIGLLSLQVLKQYEPSEIVVVSRSDSPKAKYAYRFGADQVLSFDEAIDYIEKHTPEGQGFDYVVEATGSLEGLDQAVKLVRPRGVVAAKSTHGSPVSFNYTLMVVKEVRIIGSRCGPFDKAIDMLRSRRVNVRELVSKTYPLERGVEAFEASFKRENVKVQIIVTP